MQTLALVLLFRSSAVTVLADRLFDLNRVPALGGYQWPRKEILQAFFEFNPQQAAIYWRKMDERKESIMGQSEVFDGMPFAGRNINEVNELRDVLLRRAKNDWELMILAVSIARHERSDWAVEWVKLDLLRKSGEHLLKQEVFYGTRNQVYDGVQARGGSPGADQWPATS